jgi:hypothetical protein
MQEVSIGMTDLCQAGLTKKVKHIGGAGIMLAWARKEDAGIVNSGAVCQDFHQMDDSPTIAGR